MSNSHISPNIFINGFIAWLFGATGPLLIVLNSATMGNLENEAVISWIFAIYVVGGLTSIFLSFYYKQPIAMAYTIPGAVLVGTSLMNHSFTDVLGAYIVTGLLLIVIALTKTTTFFMRAIPMPIMLAMVSGVLLPFGLNIFMSTLEIPFLNGLVLITFILLSINKTIGSYIPPIVGSIIVAFIILLMDNSLQIENLSLNFTIPNLYMPTFNFEVISELTIPLLITVIAIQNSQGIAILQSSGYKAPIEPLTTWSGIASIINGFFGAHSACVAGPMTGIVADKSSGHVHIRYKAAVFMGVLAIIVGFLASSVIELVYMIPISLIQLLAGLSLLNVLKNSLVSTFSSDFQMGALFSFMITLSDFTLFNIGSPFWGLVFGLIFSYVFEREDFKKLKENN